MPTPHKTITLTVLGGSPSLTDGPGVPGCADTAGGIDRPPEDIRRAMIVVRPDDDTRDLYRRLLDSITRLAGGAAADADRLAGQIFHDLRRTARADAANHNWTMAHIFDGPSSDPYAPRLSRLRLVDAPTRLMRIRQRLRLTTDQVHKPFRRVRSAARIPVCLS